MQSVRCAADHDARARHPGIGLHTYCITAAINDSKASCNGVCRATITACKSITGESTCDLLGKNSKLRLVAINQQYYCNGRKTRNRKVHMTATLQRRAEQNIGGGGGGGGGGAPTSIFRRRRRGKIFGGGGAARPA
jgi:uncharacterized membrane protein YgcG